MKVKLPLVLSILFSIFIISQIFGQHKALWKGKIEIIDGIKVINNPKQPMFDENIFVLEEELTIGEPEGDENYMFSFIISIDVDKMGNIYVLDVKEAHIKVFDKNGSFFRIIGRKGQGPGEFQNPFTVQISSNHNIVVFDPLPQKLTFLSLEGKYIKSISIKGLFNPPLITPDGNILSIVKADKSENPKYELHKLDLNLNSLCSYYSYPKYIPGNDGMNPFRSSLQWDIINKNEVILGHPDIGYSLTIFNAEGSPTMKITKEYTPVKIPKDTIKRATKEKLPAGYFYSVPDYYNPFRWIIVDDNNRIFVCTWETSKDKRARYYDVFNQKGQCITKVPITHATLRVRNLIFRENKLYLVHEDEDGYQYVKRYKVTWNY